MSIFSAGLWIIWTVGGCLTLIALAYDTWRLGIAPTPSGGRARRRIIELCLEGLQSPFIPSLSSDHPRQVFELGSGWGGLSLSICEALTQAQIRGEVIGYELSYPPHLVSRLRGYVYHKWSARSPRPNAASYTPLRRDLLGAISRAREGDLFICYLCPQQMRRLADALQGRPQPLGVTCISLTFALPGCSPERVEVLPTFTRDRLYLYRI